MPSPDMAVRIGALTLPNPIVAASGTFGHGDEVAALCDPTRLGAVTAKSQAVFAWPGNPAPRLHPVSAGMVNAVGLQGRGVAHWIEHDLPALRARGARVIASIWGHSVEDYAAAARSLRAVADEVVAVEVNLSCPNLPHGDTAGSGAGAPMFAQDERLSAEVVRAVRAVAGEQVLLAKLSPGVPELSEIAGAVLAAGATGLTLVNTARALVIDAETRRPALGGRGGGLSGAAIKPLALRAVHDVTQAHPGVPVIGTGGVMTGTDAVEMLLAGASAVGVGTATFLDPRATLRIADELARWCATHGVAAVRELSGGLRWPDLGPVGRDAP